jgi:predicted regulator of Ras-like GTPase activity (Roadblock/LC7/MglB family)
MNEPVLAAAAREVASLRAVLVTAMPDCLLFDSWQRDTAGWADEEVATYFGDLVRSNRSALKSLGSWSSEMQVTIESADSIILLNEIDTHFVCGCIFERGAPLGMARLHTRRLIERIRESLPRVEVEERPRAVRVMEFLHRYAPDPHTVTMRVALRAGLPLASLEKPEALDDRQAEALENAAKAILGLQTLNV